MKWTLWRRDWIAALAVVVLYLLLWVATPVVNSMENAAYDAGVRLTSRTPSSRIAVIAIDQQSLDNMGRWPWPRDIQARMIDKLAAAHAHTIVSTVYYTEPEQDRGLAYLQRIKTLHDADPGAWPPMITPLLDEAMAALDEDRTLTSSIERAGNVLVPMLFRLGDADGNPDRTLPDFINRTELKPQGDPADGWPLSVTQPTIPLAPVGEAAAGVGSDTQQADLDGVVRRVPLALRYQDKIYPSFDLLIAAHALNVKPAQINFALGTAAQLGSVRVPLDQDAAFRPYFYDNVNGTPPFSVDSFYDVYNGKIALDKYRDKIVLIGATAPGIGSNFVTPVSAAMPPVLLGAQIVSALLQQHYFVSPGWTHVLQLAVLALVAAYLILALPRLNAALAAGLSAVAALALLGAQFVMMTQALLWVPLMGPVALLALGYLVLTSKRYLLSEAREQQSAAESAESNRMLGLALQGQGQLDMAFDKLRRVPMSDDMMSVLNNLALDFERKRQFNKAETVYRAMAQYDEHWQDLPARINRAHQLAETVLLGGTGVHGTLISADGDVTKPMLGRYQIEKELGKGAMGVVYQGRDPRIGRVVAIKTLALTQEFEADMLEEARQRFFREAETAGRLTHPNIVTIYDAGEDNDLAWIAMELLQGGDLLPFTQAGKLLPLAEVAAVIRKVATALAYAHAQNVVHRDIKPANIMFDRANRTVKVMDFGIARITDVNRTRTGMVLGTPSYMSPEQLLGQPLDGRSDLFSLGVTLYQMCTGRLPFEGDSMGQLMFSITHDTPRDPREFNPKVPGMLAAIIIKALAKAPAERFQTGEQLAHACARLEAGLLKRAAGNA
ncbi:hypothetical protein JCM19000A_15250 [Silvimonas sp. JCM 19000]